MTAPDDPLSQARALTRLMDSAVAVPGTRFRVGLDPLLGLVPGLGDVAGAALAAYHVLLAARIGAPAPVIVRMVGNVALDAALGAIPLVGDVFDFGWKANSRNLALLERFVAQPERTRRSSTVLVAGAVAALVVTVAAGLALAVAATGLVLQLFWTAY